MHWLPLALLSAFFAGLTALLAKIGVQELPSNLATFIRTVVILLITFGIVAFQGDLKLIPEITLKSWSFLVLSGIATGLSWMCYFAALKVGPLSSVAPIDKLSFAIAMGLGILVLHEKIQINGIVGAILILAGAIISAIK